MNIRICANRDSLIVFAPFRADFPATKSGWKVLHNIAKKNNHDFKFSDRHGLVRFEKLIENEAVCDDCGKTLSREDIVCGPTNQYGNNTEWLCEDCEDRAYFSDICPICENTIDSRYNDGNFILCDEDKSGLRDGEYYQGAGIYECTIHGPDVFVREMEYESPYRYGGGNLIICDSCAEGLQLETHTSGGAK